MHALVLAWTFLGKQSGMAEKELSQLKAREIWVFTETDRRDKKKKKKRKSTKNKQTSKKWSSCCGASETNPTRNHEVASGFDPQPHSVG